MAIVSFYTSCKEETGNTVSAVAFATCMGIIENKKTLLISTGLNEKTMAEGLWPTKEKKKLSGLFGPNTNVISQNNMEDLDRMSKSNRLSSEIIPNYTKVALKGRLELLNGYEGNEEQYLEVQKEYPKIMIMANKVYNNVIVDLDRQLDIKTKQEIIKTSDVVVALTTQKLRNVQALVEEIEKGELLSKLKTIIAIGKYDDKSKYNAKNITRNYLKQKEIINTIPYNTLLFEAIQEGKLIDIFWSMLNLKIKDENTFFIEELKRLKNSIENKMLEIQMKR